MSGVRDFLFVQSTTEQGGAETILLNLFAASEELRGRSIVATLGFGRGELGARLRASGTEVVELEAGRLRYPWRTARAVRSLAAIARKREVRVVVGNGAHPQVYASLAARLSRTRSVYFAHMIHRAPLWKNHPIDAMAVAGPLDLALANSRASLEAMRRLRPRVRHELVFPGTSLDRVPQSDREAARDELGVRSGEFLFGVFGRLQQWKGQDVFVEAAARVRSELPNARFAVVGGAVFGLEPEFESRLRERARRLGLDGVVAFTGHRQDVPRLMAACDVVCHTTRVAEPFGMVIIEAMAQARPVIATRGGGPSEIIENGRSGLLIPPGDPAELSRTMIALGADGERQRTMGEAGLLRVTDCFSSEAMAARLVQALEKAM